jgi:uridine kinase
MNIVQVVGGPGSGKTTLALKLVEDWPDSASLLRIDRYLRDRHSDDGDDFLLLPTSLDWPLVMAHLDLLAAGDEVIMPIYDWAHGRRLTLSHPLPQEHIVRSCDWLIIEGLFYVPALSSIRLFVDAPPNVRRERMSLRESRLSQHLGERYDQVGEAIYEKHILPQREMADEIFDGRLDRDRLADQARRFVASQWAGWG